MEAQDLGRQRIEAGYAGHFLPKHILGNGLRRWFNGKESVCQCKRCRRHGFSPRDRKILWRRKWHPSPVFLPGKIPWTEEPDSFQSMGSPRVRHNEPLSVHAHTHTHTHTHTHIPGNTIALEEISVAVCKRCSIVKQIWKILLTNGQMAFFTAINMLTWTVDLLRACATCVLYQSYILKKQLWEMFISEKPQPPIELVANRARHPCWHHLGKLRLAL